MPLKAVQLGPNLYYGDTGPENPTEGAEWLLASGQRQVYVGGRWRSPPVGYPAGNGAGSSVTQQTNKSTGVTINALAGQITMNNANLGATTSIAFTVTNSMVGANDVVVVSFASGNTANSYFVSVDAVAANSFSVSLRNYTAGGLAEAVVLNFVVIKGAVT